MSRLPKISSFLALVAILLVVGVAAMPGALAEPSTPTVVATADAGELRATWSATAGAQFYVVGWANSEEALQMTDAGREWLDAFHYATIPANHTGHTITGIKPSTQYAVIIGAKTTRFGGAEPTWSQWSYATTAGQHGAGFCPITGLQIPPGGYLGVGNTATFGSYTITINSIATPDSVTLSTTDGTTVEREAPSGRRWLRIYVTLVNKFDFAINLEDGKDYVLSTEVGNAFSWNRDVPLEPNRQYNNISLLFDIPQDATTAVLAVRPLTASTGDNAPRLFRVSIPAPDAQ